jgi:hypothetical protein
MFPSGLWWKLCWGKVCRADDKYFRREKQPKPTPPRQPPLPTRPVGCRTQLKHLAPPRQTTLRYTSLNIHPDRLLSPSSVARACNLSGGIKVVWMFPDGFWAWACMCHWPACPFQVGCGWWDSGEGLGLSRPEAAGMAWGWLHRAAITARFQRWEDNRPLHCKPNSVQSLIKQTTIFLFFWTVLLRDRSFISLGAKNASNMFLLLKNLFLSRLAWLLYDSNLSSISLYATNIFAVSYLYGLRSWKLDTVSRWSEPADDSIDATWGPEFYCVSCSGRSWQMLPNPAIVICLFLLVYNKLINSCTPI